MHKVAPSSLTARLVAGMLVLFLLLPAVARPDTSPVWTSVEADGSARVNLYFFWSLRCPHCQKARPLVEAMAESHPWIVLHALEISSEPENLERYRALAGELGKQARSVPAFLYCGQMRVGWGGEATGKALLGALEACRALVQAPAVERPASAAEAVQPAPVER